MPTLPATATPAATPKSPLPRASHSSDCVPPREPTGTRSSARGGEQDDRARLRGRTPLQAEAATLEGLVLALAGAPTDRITPGALLTHNAHAGPVRPRGDQHGHPRCP